MRTRNTILAVVALVAGAGIVAAVAGATGPAQTAEVTDPAGDAKNNAEPWLDILRTRIARGGDTFTFSAKMAGALPADPPAAPGGLGWYLWFWGIDVDPDLAPAGYPFPKNHPAPFDFAVVFASDGEDYFAFVIDRRPLAVGQDAITTLVPSGVDGAWIDVFVDADLLDDPSAFLWRLGIVTEHARFGADGYQAPDRVPDNEAEMVPWPQN
jgi:hypothetical protein